MSKLLDEKTLKQLNQLAHLSNPGKPKPRNKLGPLVSLVLVVGLLAWLLVQKSQNVANTQSEKQSESNPAKPGQADAKLGATEKQVQPVSVPHADEPAEVESDKAADDKTEITIDPQSELTPG